MANVGGRQLTLGACGLTKFAETADGRKVQLHIPKYVQGSGATKHNKIIDPVLQNGTFLQDPGLEPSDLAISGLQTVPKTKWQSWRILGQVSYLGVSYFGTGHCIYFQDP